MKKIYSILHKDQDGAVAIIVALSMTVFLGLAALAIDVGVLGFSRNELQNAADAAALAGASQLARQDTENYNVNVAKIKNAAVYAAGLNKSSNTQVVLDVNDVILGKWDWEASSFSVAQPYNAVQVTISNHNVTLFFVGNRGMGASAVAIVGPISGMEGLRPFAVDVEKAEYMKNNPGMIYEFGQSPGNWGTADLDGEQGGGANVFGEWLEYGYDGIVSVGSNIFPQTGVGPIVSNKREAESLIGKNVFIPVVNSFFAQGSSDDRAVVGFISIRITDVDVHGKHTAISAVYLEGATMGGNIDLGNQSFGVLGVKLAK